jgi:hypothetical protein
MTALGRDAELGSQPQAKLRETEPHSQAVSGAGAQDADSGSEDREILNFNMNQSPGFDAHSPDQDN